MNVRAWPSMNIDIHKYMYKRTCERAGSNLQLDRQQVVPASLYPTLAHPTLDTPCSKVVPTQSLDRRRLGTTRLFCLTKSVAPWGPKTSARGIAISMGNSSPFGPLPENRL
jgi:hypothetical protein